MNILLISCQDSISATAMGIPLPRFSFKGIRALGELSVCLPRQREIDKKPSKDGRVARRWG